MIAELATVLIATTVAASNGTPSGSDQALRGSSAAAMHAYVSQCAPCHGLSGQGDGPYASSLPGSPPRDFTDGLYQYRSTLDRVRREDVARTILQGLPGTEMPAFRGLLSPAQAEAVAELVISFSPRGREEPPGDPLVIPDEPADLEASTRRGAEIYQQNCVSCHGPEGLGDGPRAGELTDSWGHPIAPRDLVWAPYEGGASARRLYTTISTGMEGTPMPPYGFLMDEDEIWDVVNYVRTLRRQRSPLGRFFHDDPTPAARE